MTYIVSSSAYAVFKNGSWSLPEPKVNSERIWLGTQKAFRPGK